MLVSLDGSLFNTSTHGSSMSSMIGASLAASSRASTDAAMRCTKDEAGLRADAMAKVEERSDTA